MNIKDILLTCLQKINNTIGIEDYLQGYLLSKPLSLDTMLQFLEKGLINPF